MNVMDSNTTFLFDVSEIDNVLVDQTIKDVYEALEEKGYNPINQIVGYLISGDPGYISSYKESRKKICKLERTQIIEVLLRNYLSK
ncbi:MAG: hypothetical protein BHW07_00520 [Clostridium sp. CAG_433_25_7]|nr:MAG: hypothetical protein BHW07_00520 [Clostridium sp. CAG_433_25_7]